MKEVEKVSVIDRYRNRIKHENRRFIEKNLQISNQISEILTKKGMSQKDLAKLLDKHESEVSKMLSGLHNLTLQSIAKMEAVLDEDIILTPAEACNKYSKIEYVTLKVSAQKNHSGVLNNKFIQGDYKSSKNQEKAA